MTRLRPRLCKALAPAILCLCAFSAAGAAPAEAAVPPLKLFTNIPDAVPAGNAFQMYVSVENQTSAQIHGNLVFRYTIPASVNVSFRFVSNATNFISCETTGQVEECTYETGNEMVPQRQVRVLTWAAVAEGAEGELPIRIEVEAAETGAAVAVEREIKVSSLGPYQIKKFGVAATDREGESSLHAAGSPALLETVLEFPSEGSAAFGEGFGEAFPPNIVNAPAENLRDAIVHAPAGAVGNPTAAAKCTAAQLAGSTNVPKCPAASQVGVVLLNEGHSVGLYNMVPPPGVPAAFGFSFENTATTLEARLRPSDNGVDVVTPTAISSIPLPRVEVDFWGLPADSSHDPIRGLCTDSFGANGNSCPAGVTPQPFLRMPTSCTGPLHWGLEVDTYQHPGTFVHAEATTPAVEGCENVPFDPSLSLITSSRRAHEPSGGDLELSLPQEAAPEGVGEADLRSAELTLPQGVSLNPAAADGLQACTDAQLRLGLEGPSDCPDAAKLGTVTVTTPLLEQPLDGSVFLRSQASSDPASGDLYRLAIELRSDRFGVDVKLPGSVKVDPTTGQLTTSFGDLPQLPFESMQLHLDSGPRAALTLPSTCGTYDAHAELTSWARPNEPVPLDSSLTIDQGCDSPGFHPGFRAGVENSTAGKYSPFLLQVTRDAGEPNLSRIATTLPEGEVAKLAGVPVCPDGAAAGGNCPAASRIGKVVTGLGEGSSPLYLPQPGKAPGLAYLAGPYKGGPYSVVTEVPAQAGPFDLGRVVVRTALRVDPSTTQVTVATDPLPQIFAGIPVSYRDVRVEIDRPRFTLNPTDCEPMAVTGTLSSASGERVGVSNRFQMTDCSGLGFKPKLAVRLKGASEPAGHPGLTARLKMPSGGANVARAAVALPHSEFLAQNHLRTSCTRVQYAADGGGGAGCPRGSIYGYARAFSPLLDKPLQGPVYLRSNGGERKLPDLVASLGGQIHVDLVGYVDTDPKTDGLRTTFASVPDAPVSEFVLKMPAGAKSLLENSTDICRGTHRAKARFVAQNGKARAMQVPVKASCGGSPGKRGAKR